MTLAELRKRCANRVEVMARSGKTVHALALMGAAEEIRSIQLPKEKDPQMLVDVIRETIQSLKDGYREAARMDLEQALANWEKSDG